MEKDLLIGDRNWGIPTYGSDGLLCPGITQGASSHSSLFEGASAPPYEPKDNKLPGEMKNTEGVKSSSRSPDELPSEELPPHRRDWNILLVSEPEVKEALLQYATNKCCYRTSPANEMKVRNLTPLNTYRYRLETFTETRETHLLSEIYDGRFVDSCAVAPPPAPWEIRVDLPPLFTDCEMHIPVPHTYAIKDCRNCKGRGALRCTSCNGAGKTSCTACGGTGSNWDGDQTICPYCSGSGDNRCFRCHGQGWVKCHSCNGSGILLYHTELTITWKTHVTEHVAEKNTGFPAYHFQEVKGKEIFSDEQPLVSPIYGFMEPSIDEGSRACIAQHRMQFASTNCHHVLRQQTIEVLPLTKVEYEWKGRLHSFFLFGNENRVYTKDYPAKCCCSVM
ncbi:protein SSUH2 homolog isoform X2 [Tiliqua scincoides]|uniref:protein SSUH2 homolog isoform X2 n=1 Tax=Tiliqua scincoides TaxID=71010 RepID=UPI0034620D21